GGKDRGKSAGLMSPRLLPAAGRTGKARDVPGCDNAWQSAPRQMWPRATLRPWLGLRRAGPYARNRMPAIGKVLPSREKASANDAAPFQLQRTSVQRNGRFRYPAMPLEKERVD